nr:Lipid-binding serum glycoprotein domain containing protein [Haemonchus contortus]
MAEKVDREIPKITIPDITLDITAGPGTGKVSAHDLNITKFKSPNFNFLLSDQGLSWSSNGGAVKVGGRWEAIYTIGVPLRESGWIEVLAADIRVNVSARVLDVQARPQIVLGDCTADIVHFDFQIGGGVLPWLVNLFRTPISLALRKAIHNQACESARSILLTNFNDFLLSLPLHIPIGQDFYLDYAMERNLTYNSDFAEAELLADVVYGAQTCHPEKIERWEETGLVPKMMVIWLSETVPNCLLSSAHEGKLVQFTVTKNIPQLASYLRTSCSMLSICIGRFFEKLRTEFPDQYVDLHFHTYNAPIIRMRDGEVTINATFAIDFYIHPKEEHTKNLARMILQSSSMILPEIVDNRLSGRLNNTQLQLGEDFSDIGEMSKTFLSMFEKVFAVSARVMVEAVLHKGIPLPIFDNVTISGDSEIRIFEKHVRLNADFEFK